MDTPFKFPFPLVRREPRPRAHPELAEGFEQGEEIPGTKCMRLYCPVPRWKHPVKGELVLCRDHAGAVIRGEAYAPPLRQRIDYMVGGRKTFLVEHLPELPIPDLPDED